MLSKNLCIYTCFVRCRVIHVHAALEKAKLSALHALLVAYAGEGERIKRAGTKREVVSRVAAAVRAMSML